VKQTIKYFQLFCILFAYGLSTVLMVLSNIFFSFNQKYLKAHRNSKTTRKNTIVEYLDYQIPVTQLKGQKGNGDMQAAKRD